MMFKVGDKVRCIRSTGNEFTKGNIYIVVEYVADIDFPLTHAHGAWVKMIDDQGTMNGWCADFFELVEPDYFAITRSVI